MDISPLLAVGALLLVVVVGLTLWQRRGVPGAPDAPAPASAGHQKKVDPVFGAITHEEQDCWYRDTEMEFAGAWVDVQILCGPEGPRDTHRAWMQAALANQDAIAVQALAVVQQALEHLHADLSNALPFQIVIGPDASGEFCGALHYGIHDDELDTLILRSTDMWTTLAPARP